MTGILHSPHHALGIASQVTRQLPHTLPAGMKLPKIESRPLTRKNPAQEFTGSDTMALMQVTVRSKDAPHEVCDGISLVVRDRGE